MRKVLILVTVTMLLLPVAAMAVVTNTSHDMGTKYWALEEAGICSPCHLPHGAQGERLFPNAGPGGTNSGAVGNLCAVCHNTGGGYSGTLGAAASDSYVYGALSHGVIAQMTTSEHPDQDTAYMSAGALPYVADTTLQCTSCHNVHDDTNRPFLRTDITALCSSCHDNRHFVGGTLGQGTVAGVWGTANTRFNNPGSHPEGTDVDDTMNAATATVSISGEFNLPFEAAVDGWMIGGHLSGGTTGGVVCVSCHSVHGSQDDADAVGGFTATQHVPTVNFLQVDQNPNGTMPYTTPAGFTRSVANGDGDFNALCEACHGQALGTGYTTVNNSIGGAPVDPGTTGWTHPLDGIEPSDNSWVTAFPANWPAGGGFTGAANAPIAICESCHVPHPAANVATSSKVQRGDVVDGAEHAFILRDSQATVCDNCHTGTGIAGHHPTGVDFDGGGASYLDNVTTGTNTLQCRSCHANNGAHNWAGTTNVGLDTNWLPDDNGRDLASPSADAVSSSMSQTCMDCHFNFDNAPHYSPVLDVTGTLQTGVDNTDSPGYTKLGSASTHFMGLTGEDITTATWNPAIAWYTPGTQWTGVYGVNATNAGWSRFRQGTSGDTATISIVCESCHELEPDKNNSGAATSGNHLLLATFTDGNNGNEAGGDSDGRDNLCEGCHRPAGTHPITGDIVDRTGVALAIDTVAKAWLVDGPTNNPNTVTWGNDPGTDMSCDSCHQVHDAADASANFILEANNADLTAGTIIVPDTNNFVPHYVDGNKGPNHEAFCQYCHAY